MGEPSVVVERSPVPGLVSAPRAFVGATVERPGAGAVAGRIAVFALPVAALGLGWAVAGRVSGLPVDISAPADPGSLRWATLVLGLVGFVGLAVVVGDSVARGWARAGLLATTVGTVGVVGDQGEFAYGLLWVGWCLFGVAALRSRILNRGDGVLLILGAGALAVGARTGQGVADLVAVLLLLAAGLGLAVGRTGHG